MDADITELFNQNKVADLTRFLGKRQMLNSANVYLVYLFHVLQVAGLLTTAIGQAYAMADVVWIGVGINSLASLVHIFEQTNNRISNNMLRNIEKIKNGTYVDEDNLVDDEDVLLPKK